MITLPVEVKKLNRQLESHFGIDTDSMNQMWRISWSDDQYEKRLTDRTDAGILLINPEVRELPKYQWIRARWILENLVIVPEFQMYEIPESRKSYECIYAFPAVNGSPLIPSFEACKFIIDLIQSVKGKSNLAKYKDPDADHPLEKQAARVDKIMEELFGDESFLLGRTITGEAVAMPQNYEKESK